MKTCVFTSPLLQVDNMYSEVAELYKKITQTLIEKGITVSTMESATSGLIASLITDTSGASRIMKGAFVTYSNEAKIMQGVPPEIIEKHSVYSKETALAMAQACRKAYDADIGIGVTGTLGNIDTENESASVKGNVYFSFCFNGGHKNFHIELPELPTRLAYKTAVAKEIANELLKLI